MLRVISRGDFLLRGRGFGGLGRRFFLSNEYKCTEAWENRLKHPICQKIEIENIYYNLNQDFKTNKRINVLDVDFLVTSLKDLQYQNEVEDVLCRLRGTPECILLPERTTHAVIRLFLDHASKEDIFNILSNRLTYGVFPNNYLCNLMMDKFLKEEDFVSAVKIAVLQMLQEDTEHPITRVLALHCCYKYLASSQVWRVPTPPEENDEDEVVKVRVKYVKNPYYDDHFDITNINHLVGKTLWIFGQSVIGDLGVSSQLIGFILHQKYDKAAALLERIIRDNMKLHSGAVQMVKDYMVSPPKQEIEPGQSGSKQDEKEAKAEDTSAKDGEAKSSDDQLINNVLDLLKKVKDTNLINGDMVSVSAEAVKKAVEKHQEEDILNQCQMYKQWEKDREKDLQDELDRNELESIKEEIQRTKEELKSEEEKLFYFDKEDELEMKIHEKEKQKENVVFYIEKKKNSKSGKDDYNPPDVHQRRNQM